MAAAWRFRMAKVCVVMAAHEDAASMQDNVLRSPASGRQEVRSEAGHEAHNDYAFNRPDDGGASR